MKILSRISDPKDILNLGYIGNLARFMQKGIDYITSGNYENSEIPTGANIEGTGNIASQEYIHIGGSYNEDIDYSLGTPTILPTNASTVSGNVLSATVKMQNNQKQYYINFYIEWIILSPNTPDNPGLRLTPNISASNIQSYYTGWFYRYTQNGQTKTIRLNDIRNVQYIDFSDIRSKPITNLAFINDAYPETNCVAQIKLNNQVGEKVLEIYGNGYSNSRRSNARVLYSNGNETLAGKLTLGAAPENDMDAATKKYVDDNIPDISSYAPLASPALTGTPTAPTPTSSSGDTQIATKEYVDHRKIEVITGTQTASTNAFLGVTQEEELYDGKQIYYILPYAGTSSSATLNLTLANGTTTGAKNVYAWGTGRFTNHFGVNTPFLLTYHSALKIGANTYEGWWHHGDYNTNDTATVVGVNQPGYVADSVTYRYQLLVETDIGSQKLMPFNNVNNSTATTKVLTTNSFNPFGRIFYYNSTTTVNANAAYGSNTLRYQQNIGLGYSFNTGSTLVSGKPVYIVTVLQSDGRVKLHSSPISQALPSTEDGLLYIYLGQATSTSAIFLSHLHPIYYYEAGAIRQFTNTSNLQKRPFHLTMELATTGSAWTQKTDPDSGETYYELVITTSNHQACGPNDLIFVSPNPSAMASYKNYLSIGARAIGQNPNETTYMSLIFHANSLPDSSILGLIVNVSVFPG